MWNERKALVHLIPCRGEGSVWLKWQESKRQSVWNRLFHSSLLDMNTLALMEYMPELIIQRYLRKIINNNSFSRVLWCILGAKMVWRTKICFSPLKETEEKWESSNRKIGERGHHNVRAIFFKEILLSLFFINALTLALSWWLKKVDAKTYLCLWTWTLLFSFTYSMLTSSVLRYFDTASSISFIVTLRSLGWPGVHVIELLRNLLCRQLIPAFISSTKQNRVKTIKYK